MFHRTGIREVGKGASNHFTQVFSLSQWFTVFCILESQRSVLGDIFYQCSSSGMGESWSRQRGLLFCSVMCKCSLLIQTIVFSSFCSFDLLFVALYINALYVNGLVLFVCIFYCFND